MGNTPSTGDKYELKLNFDSVDAVSKQLETNGLKDLIVYIGIDYTASNSRASNMSFGGIPLHSIGNQIINPYQQVLTIVGKQLQKLTKEISLFSFGDSISRGTGVCNMNKDGPLSTYDDVINIYNKSTPFITLSGPTNFAPLINKAVENAAEAKGKTLILIICDGHVTETEPTYKAVDAAREQNIEVVCIGVGDGPFGKMSTQLNLPNFHFINFTTLKEQYQEKVEEYLSIAVLQDLVSFKN
ncbi:copine, putative [Entamoeba invadens IP1]|uniref:Copine, putative n=1 Tax=Entamoeba invadens IP1 TaxID=370355 RepID=A0A0A1UGD7_ENTIV|nr:copine, putative [Entamoeba invadens IP1]ELP94804.1 copine, putative [Entamoeba invadens IP1]|eukprot:XP_004261575.1 copine, putative [Entamoeba invadens IP1]